ncbi:XRE family transcriptional regulator [Mesorhizobium sp. M2D.F.Ca.ET.232.01.1.1]|uniref:helix-turn-helix domain-containing protein n=1 Tax=Mesorhizobium sp. M2D.F.Ca.ET.232.01.1.1 TaxID=2496670 RepID=UPI000FCB2549|nr:helix-turn-helix transcriptional regulator [Mesorhizobium sp. M2D.F.Ca.ET.232.01.1.1]TGP28216.1 XRE family transcriptional regulator [Mesorhizobium sp. M2D.F.Ca.ET.232.01.1.1]
MIALTPSELVALRAELGLTQTEMADEIGLKLRAYQDLEGGKSPIRKLHTLAIERVALARAVIEGRTNLMPHRVFNDAMMAAKLFRREILKAPNN